MDPADLVVEPMWGRPRPAEQLSALFAGGWPAFIDADEQAAAHLPRVREIFSHWEFALLDPGSDELVAAGWAVPLQWDGAVDTLPAGYSDSLARALSDHDAGVVVDTAVVCAVQVRPDRASQVFTAPVATWRHWSGLALPRSGSYLVRDALTPLVVDLAAGVGTLTEPCIWVRHRLS